jgi:diguanylate cyclase (GGDEF)-like protein
MYLVPIITGSLLQMIFYGISLAWLGTAIGIVALYMSMLNQSSYLDSLTKLYNRLFFKHFVYRIKTRSIEGYYGIMIDMDRFKSINDTYGHSAGDQALKDAARIFRNAAKGSNSYIFRYAGDEFVILLKTDNESDVIDFEDRMYKEMDDFNESSDRPYTVGFSMGHAPYDCENDTLDSFLKKIDAAMYDNKARRREENGFERRKK